MAEEYLTPEEATFRDERVIAYPGSIRLEWFSWARGSPHGLDYQGVRETDWHVWRRVPTSASSVLQWYTERLLASGWQEVKLVESRDVRVYRRDGDTIAVHIRPRNPAVWGPQAAYDEPGTVFEVTLTERPRTRSPVVGNPRQLDDPYPAASSKTHGGVKGWRIALDGVDELAAGEGLVVAASPWQLIALNAADGSVQWSVEGVESDGGVELQLTRGRVLYWATDGDHVFEASTGHALDDEPGPRRNAAAGPAVVAIDAGVEIARIRNGIQGGGHDGAILWTFDAQAPIVGGPVVGEQHTYVITQVALFAVDVNTGRLDWRVDATSQSYDACRRIIVKDGRVYFGLADGTVCSLEDAARPAQLDRVQSWRPPVVDHTAWRQSWKENLRNGQQSIHPPPELADLPHPYGWVVGAQYVGSPQMDLELDGTDYEAAMSWFCERLPAAGYAITCVEDIIDPDGPRALGRIRLRKGLIPASILLNRGDGGLQAEVRLGTELGGRPESPVFRVRG